MEKNELTHYGVLGMKWGVRRTEAQLARARGSSRFPEKKTETKKPVLKKTTNASDSKPKEKSVSEMSDEELRKKLNRIQMEVQYTEAIARQNQKKESRVKKIAADIGEKAVKDVANKAVNAAIKKYFNRRS